MLIFQSMYVPSQSGLRMQLKKVGGGGVYSGGYGIIAPAKLKLFLVLAGTVWTVYTLSFRWTGNTLLQNRHFRFNNHCCRCRKTHKW